VCFTLPTSSLIIQSYNYIVFRAAVVVDQDSWSTHSPTDSHTHTDTDCGSRVLVSDISSIIDSVQWDSIS